jgi:hypothetical protein
MTSFQKGSLIAIAAGSLFAAACKKEEKPATPAAETKPADPKPADPKPADPALSGSADPKPAVAPVEKPATASTVEKTDKVHCAGINSCAGKGACKSENNACAGKNGCGGQGWVEVTDDDCKAKNGKVIAATKM